MNHTNSGTCNTREEETEGKERDKQASRRENWQSRGNQLANGVQIDVCVLAWALQNLGFCEFAFGEVQNTPTQALFALTRKIGYKSGPLT